MSHTTLRTARTDRGCARFLSTESKRIKQTLRLALFAVLVIIMLNLYHRKEKQGALLSLKTQSRRPYNTRGMSRRVNDGTCILKKEKKKISRAETTCCKGGDEAITTIGVAVDSFLECLKKIFIFPPSRVALQYERRAKASQASQIKANKQTSQRIGKKRIAYSSKK